MNTGRNHRRQKVSTAQLLSFLIGYFDDQLYYLGASIEREFKNILRHIRHGIVAAFKGIFRGLSVAFSALGSGLANIASDIVNPFKKAARSTKSFVDVMQDYKDKDMRSRRNRVGQFFHYGWMWNKHLVVTFLNYMLPVTALVLCIIVMYKIANLDYALSVSYNGQLVGYVADEASYESAQKILKDRIVYSGGDETWTANAHLSVVVADKSMLSTQTAMADNLLSVSGTEIAQATGLYVGGVFYGATSAGELLSDTIDSIIAPYAEAAAIDGSTVVKFSRDVELIDGIYPESSVVPFETLENLIYSGEKQDIYYTVGENETADKIASKNGITIEQLQDLNPGVSLDVSKGDVLLVARSESIINIKEYKVETIVTKLEHRTVVQEDTRYQVGYVYEMVTGEDGELTSTYEVEYENGEEISRTLVSEEITKPVVNTVVVAGAQSDGTVSVIGTGSLFWPTGPGYSISRGWNGIHKGIDIACATGTPLYAADNGTVVVSGWTNTGYGYYIIVDHGNGMKTLYGHCSTLIATVGEVVRRGQLIALMGSTGNSTGPHIHFEVRLNDVRVPPEPYLYG